MHRKVFSAKRKFHKLWRITVSPIVKVNPTPIFVLGNQKSGTTAIAALLAKYTDRSVALDLRGIYEPMQTAIHAGDITFEDFVRLNKYDFSRDIIKEPCLALLYPELKRVFPRAQFLMIVRDPRHNIRSILNRLGISGNLGNIDPNTIPSISPEWQLVLDGQWLGLQGRTYIEILAARWNRVSDVYLEHTDEIVLVRYEDFVADKVETIEELARRLGLPQVNDIADKVDIQYQLRGNRDVSWEEFFGLENLMRIEQICGSRMEKFGYK